MSTTSSPSVTQALVGAWRLLSLQTRADDGTVQHPLGEDATGLILYTPDGFMSAQIQASGRPVYADDDVHGGTLEEAAAAARGYLAYSGPYEVAPDGELTHHMDVSLFPNWLGHTQVRACRIGDGRLELSTVSPMVMKGKLQTAVLQWVRA
jgi:Lipocalin-like domain